MAAVFVEKGKLEQNEAFRYVVVALAGSEKPEAVPTSGMQVEERVVTLPVQESSLADWQLRSTPVGHIDPDDFPIFVPQYVLDQVAEQTLAERGRETGGILIGKLHRDRGVPEIFAEITAMIPAEYTEGDAVKLTFTADTWVAVNNAIKLRGGDELYAGYFHSHPVRNWCASRASARSKSKPTANSPRISSALMTKR